ncbi:MAG: hypothetical protein U5Q16_02590 [Gammaproteobacteria bacterium]|nr:hypothetical protein [Gammaproteobacteria bacterium]
MSEAGFESKQSARQWAWDALAEQGQARFPFPPQGRIPNFAGAEDAARRLFEEPPWRDARAIKVNPDSPQRPVRELGFDAVPVATTVHDLQVVEDFPRDAFDLPLTLICTPTRTLRVDEPLPAPAGLDWSRLTNADLAAMPILAEVQRMTRPRQARS